MKLDQGLPRNEASIDVAKHREDVHASFPVEDSDRILYRSVLLEQLGSTVSVQDADGSAIYMVPWQHEEVLSAAVVSRWLVVVDSYDLRRNERDIETALSLAGSTQQGGWSSFDSRQVMLFVSGLLGALAGLLAANPVGILAAGMFMFLTGSMGRIGATRLATWTAFEAGGLGIAALALVVLVLDFLG